MFLSLSARVQGQRDDLGSVPGMEWRGGRVAVWQSGSLAPANPFSSDARKKEWPCGLGRRATFLGQRWAYTIHFEIERISLCASWEQNRCGHSHLRGSGGEKEVSFQTFLFEFTKMHTHHLFF